MRAWGPGFFSCLSTLSTGLDSPLRVCPIHFFFLVFIVRMRVLPLQLFPIFLHLSYMFCPADFLHSSPSSHFKSLKSFKSFFPHCPCFCSIQHHSPYQCLYHPYLQCSVYFSSQKFSPLETAT